MKFLPEDFILVLAGDNQTEYAKYIYQLIEKQELKNRIYLIGKVTEEEKFFLLKHCLAFVFPSKWEGMGMPPLEAMAFGKPVFAFYHTSIPEFCKNYAFYWSSENPQEMAQFFIRSMLTIPDEVSFQSSRIEYAQQFQWKNTVQKYLTLYRKILYHDKKR
jgi:glycosyltransferase involved in cell wall biosynthesis